MDNTRVTAPSHAAIAIYWHERPEFARAFDNAPACFACCDGVKLWTKLERAHIIAHSQGGNCWVGNFLLLCAQCHRQQPMLADRHEVIQWAQQHPHWSQWLTDIVKREAEYYGQNLQFSEQDRIRARAFLQLRQTRFHPQATIREKFEALTYAMRQYIALRDGVFK